MAEHELNYLPTVDFFLFCFITCVKEEHLNIQSMWMHYVPKHSWDNADSEYVSYMGTGCKGAEALIFLR